jgi:Family of unknown function (DUF6364)
MKNVTLAVEDEVVAKVRAVAAQRATTLNAMVRDFLKEVAGMGGDERKASVARMIARAKATPPADGAPGWNREDLYDRGDG